LSRIKLVTVAGLATCRFSVSSSVTRCSVT